MAEAFSQPAGRTKRTKLPLIRIAGPPKTCGQSSSPHKTPTSPPMSPQPPKTPRSPLNRSLKSRCSKLSSSSHRLTPLDLADGGIPECRPSHQSLLSSPSQVGPKANLSPKSQLKRAEPVTKRSPPELGPKTTPQPLVGVTLEILEVMVWLLLDPDTMPHSSCWHRDCVCAGCGTRGRHYHSSMGNQP